MTRAVQKFPVTKEAAVLTAQKYKLANLHTQEEVNDVVINALETQTLGSLNDIRVDDSGVIGAAEGNTLTYVLGKWLGVKLETPDVDFSEIEKKFDAIDKTLDAQKTSVDELDRRVTPIEQGIAEHLLVVDGMLWTDLPFVSEQSVSAKGVGISGGSSTNVSILDNWDKYSESTKLYALSAKLGYESHNIALTNKSDITKINNRCDLFDNRITEVEGRLTHIDGAFDDITTWFKLDDDGNIYTTFNFYSTQSLSAKGIGDTTSSPTEGASALYLLVDVLSDGNAVAGAFEGNSLVYKDGKWQGVLVKADLSEFEGVIGDHDKAIAANKKSIDTLRGKIDPIEDAFNKIKTWFTLEGDVLRTTYSLASDKTISSLGVGEDGGTGGASFDVLQDWDNYDANKIMTLGANLGYELKRGKQDVISDLDTIRTGAALGATALLSSALSDYENRFRDLSDRIKAYEDILKIEDNGNLLHASVAFASDKTVSSLGIGSDGNGGVSYDRLDNWDNYVEGDGSVLSSDLGYGLLVRIIDLEEGTSGDYASIEAKVNKNTNDITKLSTSLNDFLTGVDVDNTINRWKELEKFLEGYTETATLANLLKGKVDTVVYNKAIDKIEKTLADWFTLENGVLHSKYGLASDKTVSSLGIGSDEDGGISYNRLDSWDSYTSDKAGYVLSAVLGWDLKTRLDNLDLGDFDLSGYLTKSEASGTYAAIASLNSYATKTWVSDNYINKDTSSICIDKVENNVFKGGLLLDSTRVAGITPYESESWILDNATGNATFNGKLEVGAWSSYPIIALLSGNTPYAILSKSSSAFTGAANIYQGNADTGFLRIGLSTDNIVTYDSSGRQTAKISTSTGEASFKSLKVNDAAIGSLTVDNSFTIGNGNAKIWWDADKQVLRTNVSFASDKTMSSLGVGTESGGGGTGGYASLDNVASDVLPSASNTFTVGNSSRLWKAVYANSLYLGTTDVGKSISSLQSGLSTANGDIGPLKARVTNIEGGYAKKATTLAGYGITDGISTSNIGNQSVNYATSAGSANKLSEERTIWGQSFDGSGDVSGNLALSAYSGIFTTDSKGNNLLSFQLNAGNSLLIGQFTAKEGYDTVLYGNTIKLAYGNYGSSSYSALVVNSSGNVTIGSSDLAGASNKLYVNGNSYVNGILNVANVIEANKGINIYGALTGYVSGTDSDTWSITDQGAASFSDTLTVQGKTELESGLDVIGLIQGLDSVGGDTTWKITSDGAATFGSTLKVAGATTLEDKLTISKNGMSVTGAAYFGGGTSYYFGSTGNVSANTLTAAGATSLKSTLSVTGATTLSSTLGVSGNATFNSKIYIGGDNAYIYWDASKRVLRTNVSFASDKTVSSLGVGTDDGGGGSADWGAVPTSIIPVVNGEFNLGTAANRWNVLYANSMNITESVVFATNSSVIAYGTFKAASIDGDLMPSIDGEYNIGSPTMGWDEIYANGVNASVITEAGLRVATKNWVESNYVLNSALATVATSGSYNDLTNKPTTLSGYGITDALKVTIPYSGYPREVELDYDDIYCKNALSVDTIHFRNGFGLTTAPDEPSNLYYDGSVILSDWNFDNYALSLAGGELSGDLTVGEWLAVRDVIYAHKGLEVSKTIKGIAENDDETWSIGGDTGEASFAKITSSGSINSKSTTSGQTVQIGHNSTASVLQCIANTTGQTGKTFLIQNSTGSSSLIRNTGVGDGSGIGGDMTFICSDTVNNEITGLLLCNKTVAPTKIAVLGTCLGTSMRTALDEYGSGVDIAGGVLAISSKETSYQNIHSAILDWDKSTSTLYFKKFYKNDSGTWTTGAMNVDVNGSLTVSGATSLSGDLTVVGKSELQAGADIIGLLQGLDSVAGETIWKVTAAGAASFKSLTVNGVAITGSGGGSFNGGTVTNATTFNDNVVIKGEDTGFRMRTLTPTAIDFSYGQDYITLRGFSGTSVMWTIDSENGSADFNDYVTASGFEQSSDYNLKTILKDVRLSLGTMANAPLVQFDWKNKVNKKHHVGTIAQYWDACLPEVVSTTTNGTLALGYGELGVAMGISLAKEMTEMLTRVDNTDSEVDKLKKRISELEKEIEDLKAV